jgi:methionyl-tRNA synthetase
MYHLGPIRKLRSRGVGLIDFFLHGDSSSCCILVLIMISAMAKGCSLIRIHVTMNDRFYITTPIYYPNGEPHLGHIYTTVAADTVARYHRLKGERTFFLTGTDEHGVKMVKTAYALETTPKELADQMASVFQSLWKELGISNDDFIRTPEARHNQTVQYVVNKLLANDDIYLGSYTGWYDEGQEEFVTETAAKEHDYKSEISGKPLTQYEEATYFFRLKKYIPRITEYIESHSDFIQPESRRNEVLSKLKTGVEDLSISRSSLEWGIKMPNDPKHVVYVWIDALTNYITVLGYGRPGQDELMQEFWPADVHLIGKEIMWFHTVYWPAMLMSLGLALPKTVFAHGWWTSNGKKMSKTMGNFIGLEQIRALSAKYSFDAVRYHMLRAAAFGNDLDWSDREFEAAYDDLCKKLGNCLNRTTNMTARYRQNIVPAATDLQELDRSVLAQIQELPAKLADAYSRLALQECTTLPIELVRTVDGYIEATAPFKLAKDAAQSDRLDTVLHIIARGIHAALVGLLPVMPEKAAAGLQQLGIEVGVQTMDELFTHAPSAGHKLGEASALFPRIEQPK